MATLTPEEYDTLHKFIAHMPLCKVCTMADGHTPGLKGCTVGHLLAVRASHLIAALMREGRIEPASQAGVR